MSIEITDEMVDAYCRTLFGAATDEMDQDALRSFRGHVRNGITAVAPLIAAAERDACEELAKARAEGWAGVRTYSAYDGACIIAADIRARSS